ncbi:MAG: DUF1156 domain-containing protein, partial [Pseudomonadota bacterium]
MAELVPFALKDAPALIEAVFPAQKISFEAQRERSAGGAQTLPVLGAYWKGRKPLILVRAIVLGCLLPQTDDLDKDLDLYEKLMGIDNEGLARRALAQNSVKAKEITSLISLENPWHYFEHNLDRKSPIFSQLEAAYFPLTSEIRDRIIIRWKRDLSAIDKLQIYRKLVESLPSYEEKASLAKRPEEVDQSWLYEPVWESVERHLSKWGVSASTHGELVEQLGTLRYGRIPEIGDTFAGAGSIPFEAARLGCNVSASDINPIACMLSWGAKHIIGADLHKQESIAQNQEEITERIRDRISALNIEKNSSGH